MNEKYSFKNLDKVFWPEDGYTKGDLIEYYDRISEYIMPYLKGRPLTLHRFPNGINGESFYQKDMDNLPPDYVDRVKIHSDTAGKDICYVICNNEESLLYLANLGCIEMHPWSSTVENMDNPDYLVMDLDPHGIGFDAVISCALKVKNVLDEIGVPGYIKTSGATGLHIYVPLAGKYDYAQAREFTHLIGLVVNKKLPVISSLERYPEKREKKVYLDYLQNRPAQTLVAPYAVRPREGAPVSTPLRWSEVNEKLNPADFTIKNIEKRLSKTGDLWKPVLGKGIDMEKSLDRLQKLIG